MVAFSVAGRRASAEAPLPEVAPAHGQPVVVAAEDAPRVAAVAGPAAVAAAVAVVDAPQAGAVVGPAAVAVVAAALLADARPPAAVAPGAAAAGVEAVAVGAPVAELAAQYSAVARAGRQAQRDRGARHDVPPVAEALAVAPVLLLSVLSVLSVSWVAPPRRAAAAAAGEQAFDFARRLAAVNPVASVAAAAQRTECLGPPAAGWSPIAHARFCRAVAAA